MTSALRALALLVLLLVPAAAQDRSLPRFATFAADEVNVRAGPGSRYPVAWILVHQAGMPVEILAEFEGGWRKIRDWEGTEGWVHTSLLSGRRGLVVIEPVADLYREPDPGAPVTARLAEGLALGIRSCHGDWCRVEAKGHDGWVARSAVWGAYGDEDIGE